MYKSPGHPHFEDELIPAPGQVSDQQCRADYEYCHRNPCAAYRSGYQRQREYGCDRRSTLSH
jgi:hypothetical protein